MCLSDPGFGVDITVRSDPKTLTAVWMGDLGLAAALGSVAWAKPKVAILGLEASNSGVVEPKDAANAAKLTEELRAIPRGGVGKYDLAPNSNRELQDEDRGEVRPGQRVLINGASGGVGTFAVQLAKAYGAEVTAVTSTPNIDLVRSLGADHVVDYTTTDVVGGGRRYDRILDTVGNRSVPDLRGALATGGKVAVTGFTSVAKLIGVSLRGGKDIAQVQAHVTAKDLELLSQLIEAGKVRPQIDRRYRFAEIPAAVAYLEQGHARAKVVVEVA